jgi:hypothetical protein
MPAALIGGRLAPAIFSASQGREKRAAICLSPRAFDFNADQPERDSRDKRGGRKKPAVFFCGSSISFDRKTAIEYLL